MRVTRQLGSASTVTALLVVALEVLKVSTSKLLVVTVVILAQLRPVARRELQGTCIRTSGATVQGTASHFRARTRVVIINLNSGSSVCTPGH